MNIALRSCVGHVALVVCGAAANSASAQCATCGEAAVYKLVCQTVYEERQVTAFKTECATVMEQVEVTKQVPVWETQARERRFTVLKPVTETSMREERYTVQRPVYETVMRDASYNVVRNGGLPTVVLSDGGRAIDQDGNGTYDSTEGVNAVGANSLIGNRDGLRQTVIDLMHFLLVRAALFAERGRPYRSVITIDQVT